jgi:alcohol dehydrogenase YqhD (iron-dependent ADH family)
MEGTSMINFTYQNTTKIIFGRDAELQVGQEVSKTAKNVLIVYTGESIFEALISKVCKCLDESSIKYQIMGGVKANPELDLVIRMVDICRANNIEMVLAIGGGSVIDTAKTVAAGVFCKGEIWDMFLKKEKVKDVLPIATIVTLPATGSESSNTAVITNSEDGNKLDIMDDRLRPTFSILNPELTYTLPAWQTFCGIVDIMSHTMERYFTSTDHVELTDRMCEGLLQTCIHNARLIKINPRDYNARAEIMWAATVSHNDILGTGRVGDWASHWIGMAMGAIYDTTHGATLSILTPAWMKHVYLEAVPRFAQFAVRVFGIEYDPEYPEITARLGISALESFFNEIGVPTRLDQVEILGDSNFEEMARRLIKYGTRGCIKCLAEEDVVQILKLAQA